MNADIFSSDRRDRIGDISGAPGTPDAVEAAALRQRRPAPGLDPKMTRARGVEWVRPTDLIARGSGRVAGVGIDFQIELARRARAAATGRMDVLSNRARRLPPISAFGRRGADRDTERGAVGRC